jgi:periplasmic protein CpxP/Spy
MKTGYLKLAAAALALMLSAGAALAQSAAPPHGHGGGAFGGPMFGFFGHQLGLSDAQKAQIKDIMTKEKPTLKPLMLQMGQSQSQLRQIELSGNFDEAQARSIATQQSQTMTELAVQRARVEAEMIQVLTPDQKTKLAEMWQKREQRFANHNQEAPAAQ